MPTHISSVSRWGLIAEKGPQGCVTWTKRKAEPKSICCLSPSLFSRRIKQRGSTCAWFPYFWLGFISQGAARFLAHLCTVVICPGAHSRCPKDLKSHLHPISKQKNRQSLGIPEHMVALCPCANSIQPWTISSCVGKWRQAPGKWSREQASGGWGWQGCPGLDLLMQGTPSIPGCCPSFMGSCVSVLYGKSVKSLLVISVPCCDLASGLEHVNDSASLQDWSPLSM